MAGSPTSAPVIGDIVPSSPPPTVAVVPPIDSPVLPGPVPLPHASVAFIGPPLGLPFPSPYHPSPPFPLALPAPFATRQRPAPLDVAAIGHLLEHSMTMLAQDLRPFIGSYQLAPQFTASGPRMRGEMERLDCTLRLFRRLVELVDESLVEQWDIDLTPDEDMPWWKRHIASYERMARLM
ncbi:uncharacterized protein ARMOST_19318 [Armillaria ostoyae]|uniref:Uncharacterized protein n=1 Tax=Armillaria ostoyae TaxID=47428 RepID=A0A284S480_ARMOS|nr:uncharacterized protein ARMOST_19318 [Armillaria ostoyae]